MTGLRGALATVARQRHFGLLLRRKSWSLRSIVARAPRSPVRGPLDKSLERHINVAAKRLVHWEYIRNYTFWRKCLRSYDKLRGPRPYGESDSDPPSSVFAGNDKCYGGGSESAFP